MHIFKKIFVPSHQKQETNSINHLALRSTVKRNIMKKLSKEEAIVKFGEDIVNKAMKTNAEPTSRIMYPSYEVPSHIGKSEYAGDPVKVGGWKLTAYYYLSPEDEENTDSFDWDGNVEFEAEEIW